MRQTLQAGGSGRREGCGNTHCQHEISCLFGWLAGWCVGWWCVISPELPLSWSVPPRLSVLLSVLFRVSVSACPPTHSSTSLFFTPRISVVTSVSRFLYRFHFYLFISACFMFILLYLCLTLILLSVQYLQPPVSVSLHSSISLSLSVPFLSLHASVCLPSIIPSVVHLCFHRNICLLALSDLSLQIPSFKQYWFPLYALFTSVLCKLEAHGDN